MTRAPSTTATANAKINGINTPNLNMVNTQLDYMPRGENQFTVSNRPWTDPSVLKELYIDQDRSMYDVAAELGCSQSCVLNWLNRHGIKKEKPWRDKEKLEELYYDKGLSLGKIGDRLGCDSSTIQNQMEKFGLPRRTPNVEKPPAYSVIPDGYCVWWSKVGNKDKHVRVHRLLAVAEYGFDAVCDMHVHHKNNIPWDNRADNIQLMTPSEHGRLHIQPQKMLEHREAKENE